MAASIFDHLRTLGSVEVVRLDDDGGLALVGEPGSRVSVDVYLDHARGCEAAVLQAETGEHVTLDAAAPLAVEQALRGLGRAA